MRKQSSQMLLRRLMALLPTEAAVQRAAVESAAQRVPSELRVPAEPRAAQAVRREVGAAVRRGAAGELAQAVSQQPARVQLTRLQAQRHHHQCRCCFRQLLRATRRQQPRHRPVPQSPITFPKRALESLYQLCQ
jgi:hypothetical protein